jgi:HD superfamily phosphohydrolase
MAGVSYGKYNIPALTDSLTLTPNGHLALRENRLDAMLHFSLSRYALYRQVYQHRVLLASDTLNAAIVQRARDLAGNISFCDDTMREVLGLETAEPLTLRTMFQMTECWWRYHISRWRSDNDSILADLCTRLLSRKLPKTVRIADTDDRPKLAKECAEAVRAAGYDPKYYLHRISTFDVHESDSRQALRVAMDDGTQRTLSEAEPLFAGLASSGVQKEWYVLPAEAKAKLGRNR